MLGLNMRVLQPHNVNSTMHNIPNRVIDYCLVDTCIAHLFTHMEAVVNTTFLHCAIRCRTHARSRKEKIFSLSRPKALPHVEARQVYDQLDEQTQWSSYCKAHNKAKNILNKHKKRHLGSYT